MKWDYSGRKGRDGQKKKIGKANERKGKDGQGGKRGAPGPTRGIISANTAKKCYICEYRQKTHTTVADDVGATSVTLTHTHKHIAR